MEDVPTRVVSRGIEPSVIGTEMPLQRAASQFNSAALLPTNNIPTRTSIQSSTIAYLRSRTQARSTSTVFTTPLGDSEHRGESTEMVSTCTSRPIYNTVDSTTYVLQHAALSDSRDLESGPPSNDEQLEEALQDIARLCEC